MSPSQAGQVWACWYRWIQWERSNPLRTSDLVVQQRTTYLLNLCCAVLRLVPDAWHARVAYLCSLKRCPEALAVAEEALKIHPLSLVAVFSFTYVLDEVGDEIPAEQRVIKARQVFEASLAALEASAQYADLNLCFIQMMDFARRHEGIAAARATFTRARKSPNCNHQVYVAAARMEFYCKKDATIATKIYELAMGKYGHEAGLCADYLDFLIHQNDETNTRALFERIVQSVAAPGSFDIWRMFLGFEAKYGSDRRALGDLEKRMREAFSADPPAPAPPASPLAAVSDRSVFLTRYSYMDLAPRLLDPPKPQARQPMQTW